MVQTGPVVHSRLTLQKPAGVSAIEYSVWHGAAFKRIPAPLDWAVENCRRRASTRSAQPVLCSDMPYRLDFSKDWNRVAPDDTKIEIRLWHPSVFALVAF